MNDEEARGRSVEFAISPTFMNHDDRRTNRYILSR